MRSVCTPLIARGRLRDFRDALITRYETSGSIVVNLHGEFSYRFWFFFRVLQTEAEKIKKNKNSKYFEFAAPRYKVFRRVLRSRASDVYYFIVFHFLPGVFFLFFFPYIYI